MEKIRVLLTLHHQVYRLEQNLQDHNKWGVQRTASSLDEVEDGHYTIHFGRTRKQMVTPHKASTSDMWGACPDQTYTICTGYTPKPLLLGPM